MYQSDATKAERMSLPHYEKLGVFYLGREYDLEAGAPKQDLVLYDSKDLTTHAVCVGMTGSGKTGLCLSLLEEAAIDHIPVIAIDPKGDLGNLLLTFPELSEQEFRPWIDEGEALRQGLSPEQYARKVASDWRNGLEEWEQSADRIRLFRDSVDLAIYTPGSEAGLPVSVIQSFAAPNEAVINDPDAFRDRVLSASSSILALLKIDADPIRSREHILLSNILTIAWQQGRSLTIPEILREIQEPPFEKVGFMDLDTFFPQKDRFQFAISMNNLLASPSFSSWMKGEPLNIERMLVTKSGKPRISIMSIAHLSDEERMFFVTILLNELLSWVRAQPGTTTLRAILYMDEVFGYFPPTANPPSKTPMLTLLKQARAYGLGVVLATQNPVDLDYKGLSNTGTWFLGRLQTDRDKNRVLDGLESAAGETGTEFNRKEIANILSGLGSRKFLLHNVHEDHPVVFQTRWALSYLRGPLTRQQIALLMAQQKAKMLSTTNRATAPSAIDSSAEPAVPKMSRESKPALMSAPPALSDSIVQRYLAISKPLPHDTRLVYRGGVIGLAKVHYADSKSDLDMWRTAALIVDNYEDGEVDIWELCRLYWSPDLEFDREADSLARFDELSPDLTRYSKYRTWKKQLRDHIYREVPLRLWKINSPKMYSVPGETEAGFRLRVSQVIRDQSNLQAEKLKAKYASRFRIARDKVMRAEERVRKEQAQAKNQSFSSFVSIGSTILGAIMGRKIASRTNISKAATAMKSAGKISKEKQDVIKAEERLELERERLADLEAKFEEEIGKLENSAAPELLDVVEYVVRPRKSDITISEVALAWMPYAVDKTGNAEPLFVLAEE